MKSLKHSWSTFLVLLFGLWWGIPESLGREQCCRINVSHPEFNCSAITRYGEDRCEAAWSGGVPGAGPCRWMNVRRCPLITTPPRRPECCVRVNNTHPEYNCGYWTPFGNPVGKNRCNAAWSFGVPGTGPCLWITGRQCLLRRP